MTDLDQLLGTTVWFRTEMMVALDPNPWTGVSTLFSRGDELLIDSSVVQGLAANRDRFNHSWIDLLDDEDGQVAAYGERAFERGPKPQGIERWRSEEDPAYASAFFDERQRLHRLEGTARDEALAAFRRRFPVAPSSSQETARYSR